ncbi:unnamed protein product [Periconia digitata]|uniref:Oxidoreductase n=1 Tax=Periconia digitata TaxID=1303443 RepID=A0A9W4U6N5_9PLEO|nr:unnamed protein product [Periconia digitata]
MPSQLKGKVDFNPVKDIPSLEGKVIFITGGSAGIGAETARQLAAHNPSQIYISGRNASAANTLIKEIQTEHPSVPITFVQIDMLSLASVKSGLAESFTSTRLDILVNCAGVMCTTAALSKDGYENQFAVNHLAHAQLTSVLLPTLLRTAALPDADVRVITLSSLGYGLHPSEGICFDELNAGSTMTRFIFGRWMRYGQSKLGNVLFAFELARRHPSITSVGVHPGVVQTGMNSGQPWLNRKFVEFTNWLQGIQFLEPEQGAWSGVWCAAAAKKEELRNGGFYVPVGYDGTEEMIRRGRDAELAAKLWDWTEGVLEKFR